MPSTLFYDASGKQTFVHQGPYFDRGPRERHPPVRAALTWQSARARRRLGRYAGPRPPRRRARPPRRRAADSARARRGRDGRRACSSASPRTSRSSRPRCARRCRSSPVSTRDAATGCADGEEVALLPRLRRLTGVPTTEEHPTMAIDVTHRPDPPHRLRRHVHRRHCSAPTCRCSGPVADGGHIVVEHGARAAGGR